MQGKMSDQELQEIQEEDRNVIRFMREMLKDTFKWEKEHNERRYEDFTFEQFVFLYFGHVLKCVKEAEEKNNIEIVEYRD